MKNAFALAAAALLSVAVAVPTTSLTVWIPQQGQTATLSAAVLGKTGLVGAAGNRIVLNKLASELPSERPLASGFARLTYGSKNTPARLEVVQGGKVTATRDFPEAQSNVGLQGIGRGPCLGYSDSKGDNATVRCFSPDLKTEWARVSGAAFIDSSGHTAYIVHTDWKREKPYSDVVNIIRRDLGTGKQVTLSYRVPPAGQTGVVPPGMVDPLDRRETIRSATELPGERFLICAGDTIPKTACRLDIVDRDFNRVLTLQGNAWIYSPQPTRDGSRLYYLGNTLQVWDAQTGKRLASIHDWQWEKRGEYTFRAYLTPDNTQAAIFTYHYDPKRGPDMNKLTAYIYRLSDGKLLSSFAVRP